jgi:hypothetical protein
MQRVLDPLRRSAGHLAMLALAGVVALASTGSPASADTCPGDLNGNGRVDGADLGTLLAGWGQPGPTDLDGNGTTDGADLGILLAAWGACPKPSPTIFVGMVTSDDHTPLVDATVFSTLGGLTTTGKSGFYQLPLLLDETASTVTITASSRQCSTTYRGSATVSSVAVGTINHVPPIVVRTEIGNCKGGPKWLPGFGTSTSITAGFGAFALQTFDDGNGAKLYAGGEFHHAGDVDALNIAKWDGEVWSPLGAGVDGVVFALAVFDDGTGPALYAGGHFTSAGGVAANNVAKWDGAEWSPLGSGIGGNFPVVYALAVFDDGTGPALYAGGDFTTAGSAPAARVAKWNGTSWSALGSGVSNSVHALTVFDDGGGVNLYVGGGFNSAGGVSASRVARWDGSQWSGVGNGPGNFGTPGIWVLAMTSMSTPEGPQLVAAGIPPSSSSSSNLCNLYRWTGTEWFTVGACPLSPGGYCFACTDPQAWCSSYSVQSLYAPTLISLPELVLGAGACGGIGWTSGSGFVDLSGGVSGYPGGEIPSWQRSIFEWEQFDDGSGAKLYAGGPFRFAGDTLARGIAAWDGEEWFDVGGGLRPTDLGLGGLPLAAATGDIGEGQSLYVGGAFTSAGGDEANGVAVWDGAIWRPLGAGLGGYGINSSAASLTVFDDGNGPALYAGGRFLVAGGTSARHIAKWNGAEWTPLGEGLNGAVSALVVFDDGTGAALYVGGDFTTAGDVDANYIAKWDGHHWLPIGTGMNGRVRVLAVVDDGRGPGLYVGGDFTDAGGRKASRIARWDGAAWHALGSGVDDWVKAISLFDDGTGPAVYVGGSFVIAGGVAANRIAKWCGSDWSAVGDGMNNNVTAMAVIKDGESCRLFVGGAFTTAGGVPANRIAKLSDGKWTPLGSGTSSTVTGLATFDDGSGLALFAVGLFKRAGGLSSSRIARWGCEN